MLHIYLTSITFLWFLSLLGLLVSGVIWATNIGKGYYHYEKLMWFNYCEKALKWTLFFFTVFAIDSVLIGFIIL